MKKIAIVIVMCLLAQFVSAQTRVITGTVTDARDGSTLPGVAVKVVGTSHGAVTDMDGNYSLKVPQETVKLTFSFIGYATQNVKLGTENVINVKLEEDAVGLDEVVVSGVAFGTPKKKLTVSVDKVGKKQLEEVPASSAAAALQGKVAGVTITSASGDPGQASNIVLRGATQISGSQSPLIIVDGVMLEGTLADINVDDIESMEVVKGASASALYGSRAGNGVIVISTKRGFLLKENQTVVTLRNEYGMNILSKKYDLAEHHAYELADDWQSQKGVFTKYKGITYPNGYTGGVADGISGDRSLSDDQYMDNPYALSNDHQSEFFDENYFFTNYVSVANRSGKTNFMASFENYEQKGIVFETEGYKRQSFRLNIDHRINSKLSISASNLYVKAKTDYPGGVSNYNGGVFFDLLLTQPDVNLFHKNKDGQPYMFLPDPWEATTENPLYNLWKVDENNKRERLLGSYNLKYNPFEWLKFEGKYTFESYNNLYTYYQPFDAYERGGSGMQYSEGSMTKSDTKSLSQTAQFTASINKQIEDLKFGAKFSYLYEDYVYDYFRANGNNFKYKDIPNFENFSKADKDATSWTEEIISENYFGIVSLDYKDRYLLDAMYRMDGSSLFGEDERWNSYYRISGAYRLTEDFPINGIQELKLRAAYGTSGQRPSFSMQYETLDLSDGVSEKSQLGNKELKPSLSKELETGININFLNRFNAELVYSQTSTSDQFIKAPKPVHLGGWPSQWINAGTLETKTIEATFGANIIKKKNMSWDVNFAFDRTRAKITKLDIPPFQTGPQGQEADKLFYIREGETFGTMYGNDFVTTIAQMEKQLPDGKSIGDYEVNSDGYVIEKGTEGSINEQPQKLKDADGNDAWVKIGDANPDFKLGISSTFRYKNFSIYMLWDWKNGGDVYNKTAQWLTRDNRHSMMDQSGKAAADKKAIPYYKTFYNVNDMASFWVEDGSYLKFRELSVAYDVDKGLLKEYTKGYISGIKIKVIGRNLLTLTNYSGYDPEVATSTSSGSQIFAYDFMGYPNYRSFSASIEIKF